MTANPASVLRFRVTVPLLIFFLVAAALLGQQKEAPAGGGSLHGRVVNSENQPVSAATVYLDSLDEDRSWTARTDGTGAYAFPELSDGRYRLRVATKAQGQASRSAIAIAHGESRNIDLKLSSGKSDSVSSGAPEFFDKPQFTVAGVSDTTNLGGHGSGAIVQTRESLATDVATLGTAKAIHPEGGPSAQEKSLRDAAERNPDDFATNSQLGKVLLESGRPREAIPYLERAAQIDPGDYDNRYQLALAHEGDGHYEAARHEIEALLKRADKADLHHLLAAVDEKAGDPLKAAQQYQVAAEMDTTEPNLFDWASELLVHHAAEPSIEVFNQGIRLFPRSERMLEGLGVALYARGSTEPAVSRLCEASDMNPADPVPYLLLGKILTAEGLSSPAVNERLQRFVAMQPGNATAHYYLAMSLSKLEHSRRTPESNKKIEALLKTAVDLDPKLALAYVQLGVLRSESQDSAGAIDAYEKAAQSDPELPEAHYRLAQAYRLSGDSVKAKKELREYESLSKAQAEKLDRKRREIRQLVYTLRGSAVGQPSD